MDFYPWFFAVLWTLAGFAFGLVLGLTTRQKPRIFYSHPTRSNSIFEHDHRHGHAGTDGTTQHP